MHSQPPMLQQAHGMPGTTKRDLSALSLDLLNARLQGCYQRRLHTACDLVICALCTWQTLDSQASRKLHNSSTSTSQPCRPRSRLLHCSCVTTLNGCRPSLLHFMPGQAIRQACTAPRHRPLLCSCSAPASLTCRCAKLLYMQRPVAASLLARHNAERLPPRARDQERSNEFWPSRMANRMRSRAVSLEE